MPVTSERLALFLRGISELAAAKSQHLTTPVPRSTEDARPIALLGVPFDNITIAETIARIEEMVASRQPHYLVTANVDFLVQSMRDVELHRILVNAHLVLCDGTPLVWASKLFGNPLPERVAGSDLIPLLLQIAAVKKYKVFFLGGAPESTQRAVANLRTTHPELNIVGHYSPPFASLLEMDHDEIVRRIREAQPDLLLVSFGCPKQEKWIDMHYHALGVPVSVGVGATIDFLAGTMKRAPRLMQKTGTEWLFRLAQEPRRLFSRYANDFFWFGLEINRQWWQMPRRPKSAFPSSKASSDNTQPQLRNIKAPRRLDLDTVRFDPLFCEKTIFGSGHVLLDLSDVEFIDSSGVGFLIRLRKLARASGQRLILVSPSKPVEATLKLMRLRDFFIIARDPAEAHALVNEAPQTPVYISPDDPAFPPTIHWRGEVTSQNAPEIWQATSCFLVAQASQSQEVRIDLSSLQFIDTTGVSLMMRAKKNARQHNLQLRFHCPQPGVRRTLRSAKLESLLLEDAA